MRWAPFGPLSSSLKGGLTVVRELGLFPFLFNDCGTRWASDGNPDNGSGRGALGDLVGRVDLEV